MKNRIFWPACVLTSLIAFTAAVLHVSGRTWLAPDGKILFWYGQANGPGTSQHFADPYSFTHFLHGIAFFWIISLIISWLGKNVAFIWRLVCGVAFESSWEVIENSATVIERYRQATSALGYYGDSILNSMSDILMCSIGFWVASQIGFRKSLVLFLIVEIILIFWIKDSLLINVIMLIHPIDAIKTWQG